MIHVWLPASFVGGEGGIDDVLRHGQSDFILPLILLSYVATQISHVLTTTSAVENVCVRVM